MTTDIACKVVTDIWEMCREISRRGPVKVYSVLGASFEIRKQDAVDFIKAHPEGTFQLLVWEDGEKRLEFAGLLEEMEAL